MEQTEEGDIDGEEDWQDVINQRKRKQQVIKEGPRTTFFVSNLPDDVTDLDVGKVFSQFGIVVDVYVARKRDKLGNVFAFVRFVNVVDTQGLLKSLQGIKIGYCKLFIKLAQFDKRGRKTDYAAEGRKKDNGKSVLRPVELGPERSKVSESDDAVSFKKVLNGSSWPSLNSQVLLLPDNIHLAQRAWDKVSLLASVKDITRLCHLEDMLTLLENVKVTIRYVGGLKVLLTFSGTKEAKDFLNEKGDLWRGWFTTLEEWTGQKIQFERVAWVKIVGVPTNLWDKQVFDIIAGAYGTVVHGSVANAKDDVLSHGIVGILVQDGRKVVQERDVKWRNDTFRVWVTEIDANWCPDFVANNSRKVVLKDDPILPQEMSVQSENDVEEGEITGDINGKIISGEEPTVVENVNEKRVGPTPSHVQCVGGSISYTVQRLATHVENSNSKYGDSGGPQMNNNDKSINYGEHGNVLNTRSGVAHAYGKEEKDYIIEGNVLHMEKGRGSYVESSIGVVDYVDQENYVEDVGQLEVSTPVSSPLPLSLSFAPKSRKMARPKMDPLDLSLGLASEIYNMSNPGVPWDETIDVVEKEKGKIQRKNRRVRKGVKVSRFKIMLPVEIIDRLA